MSRIRVASYANASEDESPEVLEADGNGSHRISAVVEETGVSKELIHHYLRQGLLPRSETRALYSEHQIRLLKQIRVLREDHHLPLDIIRRLFTVFDFDPARIESLTLGESLSKRVTEFAQSGHLLSHQTLGADEVAAAAGITTDRLAEFVAAELVSPLAGEGDERYSIYDARVVALCQNGVALGIPFESFRTIASYVRIAFELEHAGFYDVVRDPEADGERALADLFVRWEVSGSFVQNVLGSLTMRRLREFLERAHPHKERFDDVVYRPSPAFVKRYQLERLIDDARARLAESPDSSRRWMRVARLMKHAGRYEEAAFFLEQGLERWPDDPSLACALGRARVLLGDPRGVAAIERAGATADGRSLALLALARFKRACTEGTPEALIRDAGLIFQEVEAALAAIDRADEPLAALEITALCGWVLASMPQAFDCTARGFALLEQAVAGALAAVDQAEKESEAEPPAHPGTGPYRGLPGLAERRLLNAAYLLFDQQVRRRQSQAAVERAARADDEPVTEPVLRFAIGELRALICRLDPGSAFAEAAFLTETDPTTPIERRHPR